MSLMITDLHGLVSYMEWYNGRMSRCGEIYGKPFVPLKHTLVEIAGPPFFHRVDMVDLVGDGLLALGIEHPRPVISWSVGELSFGSVLSNGNVAIDELVRHTIEIVTELAANKGEDLGIGHHTRQLRWMEGRLVDAAGNGFQQQLVRDAFNAILDGLGERLGEFSRTLDPDQRRIDFVVGGVLDTMVCVEMARRLGMVDTHRAGGDIALSKQNVRFDTQMFVG